MEPQQNDFYQTVLELGPNPGRRSVMRAYQTGVREAQSIADKVCDAYSIEEFVELKKEYMTLRRAYIAGLGSFVRYGVQKDLDLLITNTASVIHMKSNLVRNEEFVRGMEKIFEAQDRRKTQEAKDKLDEEKDTENNLVN